MKREQKRKEGGAVDHLISAFITIVQTTVTTAGIVNGVNVDILNSSHKQATNLVATMSICVREHSLLPQVFS